MSQRKTSSKPKSKPRYRYQGMGFLRDISRAVAEAMSRTDEDPDEIINAALDRMGKAASRVTRRMGGGE